MAIYGHPVYSEQDALAEWELDSGGLDVVPIRASQSIASMCDLWTDSTDLHDYIELLDETLSEIFDILKGPRARTQHWQVGPHPNSNAGSGGASALGLASGSPPSRVPPPQTPPVDVCAPLITNTDWGLTLTNAN